MRDRVYGMAPSLLKANIKRTDEEIFPAQPARNGAYGFADGRLVPVRLCRIDVTARSFIQVERVYSRSKKEGIGV
jgi:hypothetical protein